MKNDTILSRGESGVLDALDTSNVPASVALVGFNVALYAAVRYAPEYLRLLGNGPVVIGLFGSAASLLAVCYPSLGSVIDRFDSRVAAIAALASLGVVLWLLAGQIGSGDGIWSVVLVFVGLVLIESWRAFGIDTATATTFVPDRVREHLPSVIRHAKTPRYAALLAGLPLVVGFLAAVSPALTAIQVVLGLAAGIGLTVVVLLAVLDEFKGVSGTNDVADDERIVTLVRDERFRSALDSLRSLPRASRQMLVGDTLVALAVGMVSVFLIITVTSVLQIDVTVLGQRLRPDAYFGVCLFAEMAVALVATRPLTRLARWIGSKRVVAGTFIIAALFPITLVAAPANATVVALLFAVFGLYHAGLPTRRLSVDTIMNGDTGNHDQYRMIRAMVRIPSALVGGVLFAVSPALAFGLATAIGTIGVREFLVGMKRSSAEQAEPE